MSRAVRLAILLAVWFIGTSCSRQPPADGGRNLSASAAGIVLPAATSNDADGGILPNGPNPRDVIRRMSNFYRRLDSLSVQCETVTSMRLPGIENRETNRRRIVAERPNRIAIRNYGSIFSGFDVISNGETLTTYFAMGRKYTVEKSPASFDELLGNPLMVGSPAARFTLRLLSDDPGKSILDGVTELTYLGRDKTGEAAADRVRLVRDDFDCQLWIAAAGDPVVLRAEFDMTRAFVDAESEGAAAGGRQPAMTVVKTYHNWQLNIAVDPGNFAFTPPAGVEKTGFLFAPQDPRLEGAADLLGRTAPTFSLKMLDGSDFRLEDHAGKNVVVLQFWKTWVRPAARSVAAAAETAALYRDKGVAYFAVSQAERPESVEAFLKQQGLDVPVAIDEDGRVGESYEVTRLPTLVVIDKKGIVQAVHIGERANLPQTLGRELDELLQGRDLGSETQRQRRATSSSVTAVEGLKRAWSREGAYYGVAADSSGGTVFAVSSRGECDVLDPRGAKLRAIELGAGGQRVRLARLSGSDAHDLLVYAPWGPTIAALTGEGTPLWSESTGGINDVWVADLEGDGRDEIIVGDSGDTGLSVFNHDGSLRWRETAIENVWHVTAARLAPGRTSAVVATSADGRLHLFDAEGKKLRTVDAGMYVSLVRAGRVKEADTTETIVAVGSHDAGQTVAALNGLGEIHWAAALPIVLGTHTVALMVSPDGRWGAVGVRGGRVIVVDLREGQVIGSARVQGIVSQLAWLHSTGHEQPLLLVATGSRIAAFEVEPHRGGE